MEKDSFIWKPYGDYLKNSNIKQFMDQYGIKNYQELIRLSTSNSGFDWFWRACVRDIRIEWFKPYTKLYDDSRGLPWTCWFLEGKINIVHNCIDRHIRDGKQDKIAFYWKGANGTSRQCTYGWLYEQVNKISQSLKNSGIKKGDTVGIYMSFTPEAIVAMFAAMKIGAVPLPIMSGFGPEAVAERLRIAKTKILFTSDAFPMKGEQIPLKNKIHETLKTVPSLKKVVVIKRLLIKTMMDVKQDIFWNDFIENGSYKTQVKTVHLDAEDPALMMFTSGTTGKPKGVIHTHAGALVQTTKEIKYNFDYKDSDAFFWYTDIGWMMAPWEIIGVQSLGGTYVVFEGKPHWPDHNRLFEIIKEYKVSTFGIAPTAIRILKSYGNEFLQKHDLSSLRILGSTGELWDKKSYMWYFDNIGQKRCPIMNISGGTELIGCFLIPLPIMPIKSCSLGGPGLGMDIDVFNDNGDPVRNEIGHLVCKKPFPSMTRGFIGNKKEYLKTYFSAWKDVWYHSDFAGIDKDGCWFLYGRADDVMKVAGRRISPSEIEDKLLKHEMVKEAAAVGIPDEIKGEKIVCFVAPNSKCKTDEGLEKILKKHIADLLGKVFRPDKIHFISALPKTRSAKIPRGLIKKVYLGEEIKEISSIENPEILEKIKTLNERKKNND